MDVLRNGFSRGDDEAHVGIFGFAEGRGDANVNGVESADHGKIAGCAQFSGFDKWAEHAVRDVFDVRVASVEVVNFGLLNVDADDIESGFGKFDSQRQTNVAQAQDTHAGFFGFYFVLEISSRGRGGGHNFLDQCIIYP